MNRERYVAVSGYSNAKPSQFLMCGINNGRRTETHYFMPGPASVGRLGRVLASFRPKVVLAPDQVVILYHINGPIVPTSANYVNSEPAK